MDESILFCCINCIKGVHLWASLSCHDSIKRVPVTLMFRLVFILFALCGFTSSALAESGGPAFASQPDFLLTAPTNVSKDFRLEGAFGYVGKADFSNGLGGVDVYRAMVTADYSIFRASYALSSFSWWRKAEIAQTLKTRSGVVPWESLHDLTLQTRLVNDRIGENWRYWINGEVSSSFEDAFPGAVGIGFDGGVAYDFWNGWMLGLTARTVALSPLSRDLFAESEFGFAVAVSQKALRESLKSLGLLTPGSAGSDKIGLNFAFSTSEKIYRLSSKNAVSQSGYLGVVRSKVGVYLDYAPTDRITLSVGPEYHYDRKYKIYNSSGSFQSGHRLDNAFGGFARILWRF